jgi:hypothetical protein
MLVTGISFIIYGRIATRFLSDVNHVPAE